MARSRCCDFNKTIKVSGTSFQSLTISQKHLSNFYFSPNDSPIKTMKNAFYFI